MRVPHMAVRVQDRVICTGGRKQDLSVNKQRTVGTKQDFQGAYQLSSFNSSSVHSFIHSFEGVKTARSEDHSESVELLLFL